MSLGAKFSSGLMLGWRHGSPLAPGQEECLHLSDAGILTEQAHNPDLGMPSCAGAVKHKPVRRLWLAKANKTWRTLSGRTAMVCVASSVYQKELADAPVTKNAGGKASKW
jgi:hypothetical protein